MVVTHDRRFITPDDLVLEIQDGELAQRRRQLDRRAFGGVSRPLRRSRPRLTRAATWGKSRALTRSERSSRRLDSIRAWRVQVARRRTGKPNRRSGEPVLARARARLGWRIAALQRSYLRGAGAERRADDRQPLTEHEIKVKRSLATAEKADQDQAALRRDAARLRSSATPPRRSITTSAPLPVEDGLNGVGKILVKMCRCHDPGPGPWSARASRPFAKCPRPRSPWRGRSGLRRCPRRCRQRGSRPARRARPGLGDECVVRSDERFGDGSGVHEVEIARNRRDQALVGNNVLGLAAAADNSENTIAGLDGPTTSGPKASISPANSSPGMSAGEPGGAGYTPLHCKRSARFSPHARTRTGVGLPRGSGVATSRISGPPGRLCR